MLMFQPENEFNQDKGQNSQGHDSKSNLDNIDANISAESVAVRKKQLENILIKLIVFGLALGTVLGLGAYYLLHKFGLTKKPYQLEQERIEQEREQSTPIKKINDFPPSDFDYHRFKI